MMLYLRFHSKILFFSIGTVSILSIFPTFKEWFWFIFVQMWFKFLTLLWDNRPNTINVVVVIYLRHLIYFKASTGSARSNLYLEIWTLGYIGQKKSKLMIPTVLSITRQFKITLQSKTGLADLLIIIQVVIDQNPTSEYQK